MRMGQSLEQEQAEMRARQAKRKSKVIAKKRVATAHIVEKKQAETARKGRSRWQEDAAFRKIGKYLEEQAHMLAEEEKVSRYCLQSSLNAERIRRAVTISGRSDSLNVALRDLGRAA